MRKGFWTLAVCTLLVSCSEETAPLSRATMADVLRDIHLAEAWSGMTGPDSLRAPASRRNLDTLARDYHQIFKKHGVTQAQFSDAYSWYKARPMELDSVYTRVMPMLTEIEVKAATGSEQ